VKAGDLVRHIQNSSWMGLLIACDHTNTMVDVMWLDNSQISTVPLAALEKIK
jgi:hypothetical protein